MHRVPAFEETRVDVLRSMVERFPLATVVASNASGLFANHLPLQWVSGGEKGLLRGHAAGANREWSALSERAPALAIFHGPNAYVSPSWYPGKHETGREVPTWNYVAVHVEGVLRIIHDSAWLLEHLTSLTTKHEASLERPWSVRDAPSEFVANLMTALVGVELEITAVRGKWKASQNRTPEDRAGARLHLAAGTPAQAEMASEMHADLTHEMNRLV